MRGRSTATFTTVATEGAILPADLLRALVDRDRSLDALDPASYHLSDGTLNEAINDAWNKLAEKWRKFHEALDKSSADDPATQLTRERLLMPLFETLAYGRLQPAPKFAIDEKAYPVSHLWKNTPIHLVGYRTDLDKRPTGASSTLKSSPHGLLQEWLNRSNDHLWGFLSNGSKLRILRDNASLTRLAYVEFDLEMMFNGSYYADFALLWLVCHQSRVEADKPEECVLERWSRAAQTRGTRALDRLRQGVETAIIALGHGFLSHKANDRLKDKLRSGSLHKQDYFRQILRLVYRLIFLFAAEDRDLLLDPSADPKARSRYLDYYSTARLRKLAAKRLAGNHADLFQMLVVVMTKLGDDHACPELALPPLDSFLWSKAATIDLLESQIANANLLDAVRALSFTVDSNIRRPVDYKNLGSEELGSVYESLLELHPEIDVDAATFALASTKGNERKSTGSYYTPPSLIKCLLDSALDPVLEDAARKPDPATAILDLKVCDPACGSGHFLIASAHRIAKKLAAARSGDSEPSPADIRKAVRDVIGHCLYGVDINPMAVELCKVALWMEALVPGKPLSFLDHHIQCGDSLLGTTPALLKRGIPDEAFDPIEGDDKAVCKDYRKQNKDEKRDQTTMFDRFRQSDEQTFADLSPVMIKIRDMSDDTIDSYHQKERAYGDLQQSAKYRAARLAADAWCAAFVIPKIRVPAFEPRVTITQSTLVDLQKNPLAVPSVIKETIESIADRYQFFHWHLAFLDVFESKEKNEIAADDLLGWSGGFDVVVGNPPWERIKLQEQEWFAERDPAIAKAPNAAARKKMIQELKHKDESLFRAFQDDIRKAEGQSRLVRDTGRYPLCGRGDVNTYSIFAELNRQLIQGKGRVGCIVPSGIASDDTTKFFFQDAIKRKTLVSLYSFENEEYLFPAVDHRVRFCLITFSGPDCPKEQADFVFFARNIDHLANEDRHFTLSAEDIWLMNPNTGTCPIFRSKRDAEINKAIYRRVPVLIREGDPDGNPWGITFKSMFHMSNDSGLFRTRKQLEDAGWVLEGNIFRKGDETYLPLYEAKMVHHFDHRFGTYEGQTEAQANMNKLPELTPEEHADPYKVVLPRYWVPKHEVDERLEGRWDREWLIGWRDVCRNNDIRSFISTVIPRSAVSGKFPLILFRYEDIKLIVSSLLSNSSFIVDYVARQKIGGTSLSMFVMNQIAIINISNNNTNDRSILYTRIINNFIELYYTSYDLVNFAQDLGYDGPPFQWNEERRFLLRCELDAIYFHLYEITRDDVDYIMDTFPIVRKKDEAKYGEYRTKRVILEIYDRMAEAIRSGEPYQTLLDPPPADPRVAHPPRECESG